MSYQIAMKDIGVRPVDYSDIYNVEMFARAYFFHQHSQSALWEASQSWSLVSDDPAREMVDIRLYPTFDSLPAYYDKPAHISTYRMYDVHLFPNNAEMDHPDLVTKFKDYDRIDRYFHYDIYL